MKKKYHVNVLQNSKFLSDRLLQSFGGKKAAGTVDSKFLQHPYGTWQQKQLGVDSGKISLWL